MLELSLLLWCIIKPTMNKYEKNKKHNQQLRSFIGALLSFVGVLLIVTASASVLIRLFFPSGRTDGGLSSIFSLMSDAVIVVAVFVPIGLACITIGNAMQRQVVVRKK